MYEKIDKNCTFCTKQQVIIVEDVIRHNYSEEDLNMNISQKFATAVGLSSVDEENFEVVREFMEQKQEQHLNQCGHMVMRKD